MNSILGGLLQAATLFLLSVQKNPSASLALGQQAIILGSHTVQLAAQEMAVIPFSIPKETSIYPSIKDLEQTAYLNDAGKWVSLGGAVRLVESSVSFGDLNGDGIDDAAAIVQQTKVDGSSYYSLAAFINQGGILFNIADLPLGSNIQAKSHSIQSGQIVLGLQNGSQTAASAYFLLGDRLFPSN